MYSSDSCALSTRTAIAESQGIAGLGDRAAITQKVLKLCLPCDLEDVGDGGKSLLALGRSGGVNSSEQ